MKIQVKVNDATPTVRVAPSGEIVFVGDAERYEGEYEVTPAVEKQTLQTAKKIMKEDITVKEIPYAEVSNPAGGTTVIIG